MTTTARAARMSVMRPPVEVRAGICGAYDGSQVGCGMRMAGSGSESDMSRGTGAGAGMRGNPSEAGIERGALIGPSPEQLIGLLIGELMGPLMGELMRPLMGP